MKPRLATLAALLLTAITAPAQPHPDTLWTYLYNPTTDERAYGIFTLPDEGYIIGGTIERVGQNDFFLTRINSSGQRNWVEIFGGEFDDEARGLCLTPDGGYALMGRTRSFGTGSYDLWLVRANYFGDTVWTRTYGSTGTEWGTGIALLHDGGFALAGYTSGFGAVSYDMLLVRTDVLGNERWHRIYDGFGHLDEAFAVAATADSGLVLAGCAQTPDFPNPLQVFVVRTDSLGDTLWTRAIGKPYDDAANAVAQTSDGGFILAGYTMAATSGLVMDGYLVKLNSDGDTLWTRTIGGTGNETFYAVQLTPDHGYILSGYVLPTSSGNRDMWLVKTDSLGHVQWDRTYDHGHHRDEATCLDQDGQGGYIVAGFTIPSANADLWVIRTGPDSVLMPVDNPAYILPPSSFILSASPNPFNSITEIRYSLPRSSHVSLKVFDVTGREVAVLLDRVINVGEGRVAWDAKGAASGVYFVHFEAVEKTMTQKLLLVR